jgi:hypothetical protein
LKFKPGNVPMLQSKTLISMLIVVVIGLQLVPAVFYEGPIQTRWPFMMWAMYAKAQPPGPVQATKNRLFGVTSEGSRIRITGRLVGLPWPAIGRMYMQPMRNGDSSAAQQLANRINRNREDPFVELRFESETYTVADTGIVRTDNPVITYRVHPSASR